MAILAVVLIGAFLALRWYYLRTSREVKRLEAVGEKGCMKFEQQPPLFSVLLFSFVQRGVQSIPTLQ